MTEQRYFEQFAGDPRLVKAYYLFADGSAGFSTASKDNCIRTMEIMKSRHPILTFEIAEFDVPEDQFNEMGVLGGD